MCVHHRIIFFIMHDKINFVIKIGIWDTDFFLFYLYYYFPKYKTDLYKYRYLWAILETHLITFRAWLLGSAPISCLVPHMTDQSKSGTWMSWHTSKRCEYTIKDNIHVDTYLTEKMSLCSLMFVWNLFTLW